MTTPNQLLDTYVIETIIKDETAAGLKAAQDNLNKTAEIARKTAAELTATGEAGGDMATQIAKAVPSLDKMAARADAVTKAYNALKRAQADLVAAQQAVDRAMQAGDQDIDKMQRTVAAFAEKVDIASKKLGEQRAIAAANEASISAWAGAIGEGSQAVTDYANSVAAATRAQSQMSVTMAQAAGGQENLNRILGGNASTDEQTIALMSKRRAELDDVYAASMKYATALEKIDDLEALSAISTNVATAAREKLNAAYAESAAPLQNIIAKEQEAAAAAQKSAAANEALRQKIDPVYRMSKQYEAALGDLDEGLNRNLITQKQYGLLLNDLNAGYEKATTTINKMGEAHNGAAYAARFLGIQFSQAISGILTGQNVFTVILQQGHQLIDVFLAMGGGMESIGPAFAKMFSAIGNAPAMLVAALGPIPTAILAITAVLVTATVVAYNHQVRIEDLSNTLRASQKDFLGMAQSIDMMARSLAATTNLSSGDAFASLKAFASSTYLNTSNENLMAMTKSANDLSRVLGITVPEAAQKLVQALRDPTAAAKNLAEQGFGEFNASLTRQIELMQMSGNLMGAQTLVMETYAKTTAGAADSNVSLKTSLEHLSQAFFGAKDGSVGFLEIIGTPLVDFAARAVDALTNLFTISNNLIKLFKEGGDSTTWLQNIVTFLDPALGRLYEKWKGTSSDSTSTSTGNISSGGFAPIQDQIKKAAGMFGLDPDFVSAVQQSENVKPTGQTTSGDYTWATSSTGRGGPMQTYSGSVADVKKAYPDLATLDPSNTNDNIILGTAYLAMKLKETGSTSDAVMAYHLGSGGFSRFKAGEQVGDSAAASQQAKDVTSVYTGTGLAAEVKTLTVTAQEIKIPEPPIPPETTQANQQYSNTLGSAYGNAGVQTTADTLAAQIKNLTAAQERAKSTVDWLKISGADPVAIKAAEGDVTALTESMHKLQGQQNDNITQGQQVTRSLQDQLPAASALTEGQRVLAQVTEQLNEKERSLPGSVSATDRSNAITAATNLQSAALAKTIYGVEENIAAQKRLSDAYGQGYEAVGQATAYNQAYIESVKLFPVGSEKQKTALATLTAEFYKQNQAIAETNAMQKALQNTMQTKFIEAETRTLGEDYDVREAYLNHLRAQQDLIKNNVDLNSAAAKASLASTDALSKATATLRNNQIALTELESTYDTVMGDISNSITDAFKIGGTQVLKFKDIATSVINDLEKEFLKLALINPLKNALFGTNLADITSVGGLFGSLFGNSGTTAVGSTVSGGSSIANLVSGKLVSDSTSVAEGGSVGVLGGASAAVGGAGILDKVGGLFTKGTSTLTGLANWATDKIINLVGNADQAFDIASSAVEAGSISNSQLLGASFANALGASDATAESVALVAGQIADALPYIGTAITIVTDLATGNYRGAAIVGTTAAAGAAIGTWVFPGLGTAAGLAIGATIGSLIDTFFPAHALNPYQNVTESAVGGRLAATDAMSQVMNTDSTVASLNKFNTAFNSYMDAWGIQLGNADSVVGNFGQGIKGFTQLTDINQMFSTLYFKNAVNDGSNFAAAKGALTGMTFQNTAGLEAELEKIAGFAASMDALGIQLVSVGKDLTQIQVGSVSQSTGADKDLRIALNTDLPKQTFATAQALSDEIDKVNTFVNSTVPGLMHPIEQTTSSIVENANKVSKLYDDAINQAISYGLDYTAALKKGEAEALAIVRKSGTDAIANNATTIRDTLATTISGNVNYIQTTMDNFDISSRATMDSVSKTWTDTYGDIVKNTHDYVQAMKDEADVLSVSRLDIQFKAQNTSEQNALGMLGTDTSINARGLTAQGLTGAAALANLDVSQALEVSKYKATLEQYYGIGYITTQEYLDKINKLEEVQGMERAAIVKKYGDALTGQFAKQHQAYTDATADFNTAKNALISALNASISSLNTQISAIKSNTDALHNASLTLTNFTAGMKTGASSPLTPKQQLDAAQAEFNKQVGIMHGTGSVAERTAAASGATSAANTLLTQAGSYFGQAGTNYASIFNTISDTLNSSADSFAAEGSVAQQQLDIMQRQLDVAQALLDKTNALGAGADANFATLEATMIAKFNNMINALYDLNKVDPTPGTIADAGTYTQQGNSYGLPDIYNNRSIADQQALASERVVASNTPTTADWTFSDGTLIFTNTMPFPTGPFNKAAYTIKGWFAELGQTPSLSQLKAATTDFMSGMNGGSVFDKIYAHQYALGGFVNGGIWNRDSVPAMLAGGEFVVTANQASRHADILPSINAGTYSGDNGALLEELRAIRAEMAQLKAEMSRNTQISAQGSLAVAAAVSEKNMDMDVRLKMSQRKIAA